MNLNFLITRYPRVHNFRNFSAGSSVPMRTRVPVERAYEGPWLGWFCMDRNSTVDVFFGKREKFGITDKKFEVSKIRSLHFLQNHRNMLWDYLIKCVLKSLITKFIVNKAKPFLNRNIIFDYRLFYFLHL